MTLYAVELNGAGGYEPGKIKKVNRVLYDLSDFEYLCELLSENDFWNTPTLEPPAEDGTIRVGVDGARWIIEGQCNGIYHVVNRWSPEYGKYQKLCLYFLRMSGLNILLGDIY